MSNVFVEKMRKAARSGQPFVWVSIVETAGSSPQKPGARMLVFPDGTIDGTVGGGAVEYRLIQDAVDVLRKGRPRLVRYDLASDVGMACGGAMTAWLDPFGVDQRVIIFGCGHVARALAPVLVHIGFQVTVVDDRPEWADGSAFPEEVEVKVSGYSLYAEALASVEDLFVLVMTRGHQFDYPLLRHFVTHRPRYLGVMASRTKAAEMERKLAQEGVANGLEGVHIPIGLSIGSTTPDEIAISIAAELIAVRNRSA